MRNLSLVLLTAASALTLTASTALAEPSYSTVGCIPSGAPNASVRHNMNFVFNESSTAIAPVLCPVVKHERNNALLVVGTTARVIDRDVNGQVFCTFASLTENGLGGGVAFATDGSGDDFADSATTGLSFTPVPSHARGFYVLSCDIPPKTSGNERSGILSYHVPETPLL